MSTFTPDARPQPNEAIRNLRYDDKPYWDLERARIGVTRTVPVEVIVNGERAAVQNLVADGKVRTLTFDLKLDRSSWVALRVLPSAPTIVTAGCTMPLQASGPPYPPTTG